MIIKPHSHAGRATVTAELPRDQSWAGFTAGSKILTVGFGNVPDKFPQRPDSR